MTFAFVFPGQGSQSLGMLSELGSEHDIVQAVFGEASEVLGYDLWDTVQNGPEARLNETVVTQPAMLAAGVATWRIWQQSNGADPAFMAGHSLGEYSALVCAGALPLPAAVKLVQERSQLMADAVPGDSGAMAALIGMDEDGVAAVCDAVSGYGVCEAVNFNSPGQIVIAGHRKAIEEAVGVAEEKGARRAILLSVSVPSHSSLMTGAGEALAEHLATTEFEIPDIPVISSVNASRYEDTDGMRRCLSEQVYRPVRWVDTVTAMIEAGVQRFVECGPGKVLTGLGKRIDRSVPGICIDTPASLQKALQ